MTTPLTLFGTYILFALWQSTFWLIAALVCGRLCRRTPWKAHVWYATGILAAALTPLLSTVVHATNTGLLSMSVPMLTEPLFIKSYTLGLLCAAGTTLFALALLYGIAASRTLMFHAVPYPDRESQEALLRHSKTLRNVSLPILFTSPSVKSPTVWCWGLHPAVLLPESIAAELRSEQRDAVFLHELSHIVRRDHLTALFVRLCGAVLFWNPLYWLVLWQSDFSADESCDLVVLTQGNIPPQQYSDTLLRLVAGERSRPVLHFLSRKEKIMKRINRIVDFVPTPIATGTPLWTFSVMTAVMLLCVALAFCQGNPIAPEKAMMMGYVEDYFANNARDITMRKSLEWGDVKTDDTGNRTIRYKFEALIWDKDRIISNSNFTFDKDGKYVDMKHVEGFPKPVAAEKPDVTTLEGVQRLVEKFFSQNFRDITARKTISWGELEKHEDGSVSLVYRYEATIWGKDVIDDERRFTFDKSGNVKSWDRTEGFPKPVEKVEQASAMSSAISFLTPAWILEQEAQERPMYYRYWDGYSAMSSLRFCLRIKGAEWLNITPEQKQQFRFLAKPMEIGVEWFRKKREEQDPELMKAYEEAENAKPIGDPQFRRATEEQKRAYVKAAGKPSELFDADVSREIEKALTSEQLEKLRSLEFTLLPELGFACPAMFDCLGLSNEQKAKVDAIREELRPEFEKMLDLRMEARRIYFEKMIENVIAHDKVTPLETDSDAMEAMNAAGTRANADRMVSQKNAESEKQNKEFANRLKSRLMELLTAEQKAKMQTMIANSSADGSRTAADGGFMSPQGLTHLVVCGAAGDFNPQNYQAYHDLCDVPIRATGANKMFSKMQREDGKNLMLTLTDAPEKVRQAIDALPQLEYIRTERLTKEMYEEHIKPWAHILSQSAPTDGGYATPEGGFTHLIVFGAKDGFVPTNPMDYMNFVNPKLEEFKVHAGYFRSKPEDGKLIAFNLTTTPEAYKKLVESIPQFEYIRTERLTKEMFEAYEKTPQLSLPPADGGYATPEGGFTHLIVFGAKDGFVPTNPMDYLNILNPTINEFGVHSGYFRSKVESGKLVAYFLTTTPEAYKKLVESIPQFEYIRTERLTKESFEAYEKTAQESLPSARLLEVEQSDWFGKLNERQKQYVRWDENQFAHVYDPQNYDVAEVRDVFEKRWLAELEKPEPVLRQYKTLSKYDEAIFGLATIKSDKALKPLLKIATERVVKDNAYRHTATKALGILGDPAAVPELIPLVYHFNMNTRLDAQVSLVRLTGQNFGNDAKAWGEWYNANRDKLGKDLPAFDSTPVDWSCGSDNQEIQRYSDPAVQEESDSQFFGRQ